MTGAGHPLDLVAIGESMVVLVPEGADLLEHAPLASIHCGGAESNVAHYLAQLGHPVGWASRVGDDPFGRRLLAEFRTAGIDLSHVEVVADGQTGIYFKDSGSDRSVYYYRAASAASAMTVESLLPAVRSAGRLHVTGITAALNGHSADLVRGLMESARDHGRPVSFDVNYRAALWSAAEAAPVLAELARMADTVFVGRDEAEAVWGVAGTDAVAEIFPAVPEIVVKDGAVGATTFLADGSTVFEPSPRVRIVDPVGAGDAFAAGYLGALLRTEDTPARLRWGHLLAAHALRGHADYATLPPWRTLEAWALGDGAEWAGLEF
ncbi:MAG: sugar kinase [Propionibacteriaceae bacterium]